MAFFGRSLDSRKIDINNQSATAEDPEILKRLQRIESNFDRLDEILTNLETRFEFDERLSSDSDTSSSKLNLRKKKPR